MVTDLIRRYVLEMTPRPAPGLAPPFLVDGTTVYITDDGAGIAPLLAERLTQAGAQATVAMTACPQMPVPSSVWPACAGSDDIDAALAANAEAFQIATTIAAGFEAEGGLFVTVQDTGGDLRAALHERRARLAGRPVRAGQDRRPGMAQSRRAHD